MAVMQDKGASILAKLKNKAKASNISYQQCLQLFFQEEFLRRLAKSPYAQNFILKGGLFIYTLTNFQSRATVDIDFLVQKISNEANHMDNIIAEIISVQTGHNDVVIFESGKTQPIALQMKYQGIRTNIIGRIKKVRLPFNIDGGGIFRRLCRGIKYLFPKSCKSWKLFCGQCARQSYRELNLLKAGRLNYRNGNDEITLWRGVKSRPKGRLSLSSKRI